MYPPIPGHGADRGRSPIASVGLRLGPAADDEAEPASPLDAPKGRPAPAADSAQPAAQPLKDHGDAIDAIE